MWKDLWNALRREPRSTNFKCLACMETFPEYAGACASSTDTDPASNSSSSSSSSSSNSSSSSSSNSSSSSSSPSSRGCGHYFCTGCVIEYVRGAVRDRRHPIRCPMGAGAGGGGGGGGGGCGCTMPRECVLALLAVYPAELQAYLQLEAESTLDSGSVVYCPHKTCSSPLILDGPLPPDEPVSCPACNRGFCPRCQVTGWHEGYTCARFQALPAHQRSAEDAAVLQLSARQRWRACPKCKRMVERKEGCNHMSCICGGEFCYRCGEEYVRGHKRCACPLDPNAP